MGTTCATKSSATAVYSAGYDAWGNETSRTYNSVTSTLSYDTLNRMTEYNAGANSQEFYLYDASGTRVLKRSISGGSTKLTAYAFGLQELSYTGAGAFSSQTDYYAVAGHLIGSTNGTTTTYDLTDAEGSVLTSLSASGRADLRSLWQPALHAGQHGHRQRLHRSVSGCREWVRLLHLFTYALLYPLSPLSRRLSASPPPNKA